MHFLVRNTGVNKNSATIEKAPPKYELHFFDLRVILCVVYNIIIIVDRLVSVRVHGRSALCDEIT